MRNVFFGRPTISAHIPTIGARSRGCIVYCNWEKTSSFVGVRRVRNEIVQLNRTNSNGSRSTVLTPEKDRSTHVKGLVRLGMEESKLPR